MAVISLPDAFKRSYDSFERFPNLKNTLLRKLYGVSELEAQYKRLSKRQQDLLVSDQDTHVPIRDILANGKIEKNNYASDAEIRQWLGDSSKPDPRDPTRQIGQIATKEDPMCRLIFLVSDSVTKPLKISLKSLQRIFTYHEISPNFLEFLDVYGMPNAEDQEMRFCGFRTDVHLQNLDGGSIIPDLNRSGRRYSICYNLKTVKEKRASSVRWKIRQEAIYHQFDVGTGTQCWVFGDPHAAMKQRLAMVFHECETHRDNFATVSNSFSSSLDVHLEAARWSSGDWRSHMSFLEQNIRELTSDITFQAGPIGGHLDTKSQSLLEKSQSLLEIQDYENKINDAILSLESNTDNMESLQGFYQYLVQDVDFPETERNSCQGSVKIFQLRIRELVYNIKMQIRRARVLLKEAGDQKAIFAQLLQTQAGIRAEKLSSTMWRQAEKTSQEAIAMRIITVITLLYLPPTFVSTVFSTEIVSYQREDGSVITESYSPLALQRWLAVSLPLTLVTVLAALGWYWHERRHVKGQAKQLEQEHPDLFRLTSGLPGGLHGFKASSTWSSACQRTVN
ncbi:hypothetical protein F5Y19DRAFT_315367 [Xylariaceae sp. FL1651]|nr:hypothetical protein F5Y19DRAFT_315367 [Xylariaceae sp. FL1651]